MLTQRLGSATQKDMTFIDSLIEELKKHPGSCDEVWLATDYGFPPMNIHHQSAETLKETAAKFRDIGIRVSLQLSNSIGHGEYMASQDCSGLCYDGTDVEFMVGHDGTVAGYCFCWNGKNFRRYVMEELRAYVSAIQPYCVWVDDDLRATNHAPVSFGCFCDDCMKRFNEKYGSDFTREELVQEISFGDIKWRERHIEFIRDSLHDFVTEMGTVIHEAAPKCRMGYQYAANGGYTGFGYDFILSAMRDTTGKAPLTRPGGGSYNDHYPSTFIDKAEFLDYQNYMLPDYVEEIRPEIENLPDVVYGKSIGGTCFETSYYMASGSNAMSYAMLMNDYEPMDWHGKMLSAFADHRPFWEKLCETSRTTRPVGLRPALSKKGYLRKCTGVLDYTAEYYETVQPLRYVNLPICFSDDENLVTILTADNARVMTDEEITSLLNRPVIASASAVETLIGRGYAFPAAIGTLNTARLVEEYADHPVNAGFAGRTWCGTFLRSNDYEVIPAGESFEPLGTYISHSNIKPDGIHYTGAVISTSKGAKWGIVGFDFGNRLISTEKRNQMLNLAEYISGSRQAGELITPIQGVVQPRVDKAAGKTVRVCVTNCSLGDSGPLDVIIRNPIGTKFTFMAQYEPTAELKAEQIGRNEYKVTLPNIRTWSVGAVFCE